METWTDRIRTARSEAWPINVDRPGSFLAAVEELGPGRIVVRLRGEYTSDSGDQLTAALEPLIRSAAVLTIDISQVQPFAPLPCLRVLVQARAELHQIGGDLIIVHNGTETGGAQKG